ncbi:hypothetical protein GLOTRDRAFT_133600 [Gloeophyllum trabeum ATCC 11539]|uniref:Uncharacterized protein n=1 Tax=Gloeophyllum trabeum (strain ATCC 11539 / FP-39264 / Madison 617) TaxID=670483 RepID=S7R992_GLOTA|nr:uncharacterized protein GLOTRDRAFT_133600 [Gloeophyllum trabeum ATCC 11539]EPQ50855.1 hypothetical protein GLOTRDRAFT_133600 [Gloeophyllum trabeum ATCC 11539]
MPPPNLAPLPDHPYLTASALGVGTYGCAGKSLALTELRLARAREEFLERPGIRDCFTVEMLPVRVVLERRGGGGEGGTCLMKERARA